MTAVGIQAVSSRKENEKAAPDPDQASVQLCSAAAYSNLEKNSNYLVV